eukprot:5313997-Amphidinium_carterae.1
MVCSFDHEMLSVSAVEDVVLLLSWNVPCAESKAPQRQDRQQVLTVLLRVRLSPRVPPYPRRAPAQVPEVLLGHGPWSPSMASSCVDGAVVVSVPAEEVEEGSEVPPAAEGGAPTSGASSSGTSLTT